MTDPKPPNDLTKKTSEIVLKGIAKRVIALGGIPGEVVDVAAAIVQKYLSNPNDLAAAKAFKTLEEEIVSDLAAKSDHYKDGRPPSKDDVEQALIRFATEYKKAGSHKKRWVLFNAFHNSFRPEFYDEGLALILWDIVDDLQYPDLAYLKRILEGENPSSRAIVYLEAGAEFEFAKRLEERRLVTIGTAVGNGARQMFSIGIAEKLTQFALEDFWKEDDKPSG